MSVTDDPRTTLVGLLTTTIQVGASDLHLRVDSPPQIRLHGQMTPLEGFQPLTTDEAKQLAYSFLTEKQREAFESKLELDFSIGLDGRYLTRSSRSTSSGYRPL
jgi:twitching motility protein PilT